MCGENDAQSTFGRPAMSPCQVASHPSPSVDTIPMPVIQASRSSRIISWLSRRNYPSGMPPPCPQSMSGGRHSAVMEITNPRIDWRRCDPMRCGRAVPGCKAAEVGQRADRMHQTGHPTGPRSGASDRSATLAPAGRADRSPRLPLRPPIVMSGRAQQPELGACAQQPIITKGLLQKREVQARKRMVRASARQ